MATRKPLLKPGETKVIDPKSITSTTQAIAAEDAEQKRLRRLIERRHPEYECHEPQWEFMEETYEGGREWFESNIFRYIKEGNDEYTDRVARCYRFNHTREVVDLLNKYLFKQHIARNEDDAPEAVKKFWKSATRNGMSVRELSKQASKKASTMGRTGVVVDNNAPAGALNKADEKGIKTYAYLIGPKQLLDYDWDADGKLLWVLIEECYRDAEDPYESSGDEEPRWRLWTRTDWTLYKEVTEANGRRKRIVVHDQGTHNLGEVPVYLHDHVVGDERYAPPSLIDDIAYLDRAVANYLSNLDAIIQDQTFSQLVMPAQNLLPGDDDYKKMLEMSTKRVFLYDGAAGNKGPEYISPDPKQAQMVIAVIKQIINEIYHTVGLAGERTKQDNSEGIDNSSGVAKMVDFERVNALLAAKADSQERLENWLVHIVCKWNGQEAPEEDLVTYPDNFDVRSLYDELDMSARLMLIDAPETVRREQMAIVVEKLFPQLKKDIKDAMLKEMQSWPLTQAQQIGEAATLSAEGQLESQITMSNKQADNSIKVAKATPKPAPAKPAAKKTAKK